MIFTAGRVYQITIVELTPLQLVLVGTSLELAVLLFEIPTGVVADVYSRRTSIIIGVFLIGLGFIVEGSIPYFYPILFAQLIWGLGYTFTSGATQAWITDEIGESAAGNAFIRSRQLGQIAALLGIGAGVLLGTVQVNLPIQIGGVLLLILGGFLILVMPEVGFIPVKNSERNSWENMSLTFKEGIANVQRKPMLRTILVIGFFYGLYSEGLDRLWTKHILDNFVLPGILENDPVILVGLIRAVGMVIAVAATEVVRRRVDTNKGQMIIRALFLSTVTLTIGLLVFVQTKLLGVALIAFWTIHVSRTIISPLYTAWINQQAESRIRATIHSMSGQVDAVGQILGGPVIGLIGSKISVQAALTASSILLLPTLPLYIKNLRRLNE